MKSMLNFSAILILSFLFALTGYPEQLVDPLYDFVTDGTLSGNLGVAFNFLDYRKRDDPNAGVSWGLMNLKYSTPDFHGFRLATWVVGVQEIWQERQGDYDDLFVHELDLRDLNLRFRAASGVDLALGRIKFKRNASMDGDSHEGIGVKCLDLGEIRAYGSIIHRWINNDNTKLNAKGITGWVDVEDVNERAGDIFLNLMLDISPWDGISFLPYFNYQENVMAVGGCEALVVAALDESWSLGVEGIYAFHGNLVPESIQPGYEDVGELLLRGFVTWEAISLGGGWYWLSDDKGDIMAGMFDTFDPLEKDDYYPFDDLNHASEFYLEAFVDIYPVLVEAYWALGKNHAYDVKTQEFNLWAYWDILDSLELGVYWVWTDYDGGAISDYNQFGTSLTFNF